MALIMQTINLYLIGMSFVYLFAFTSIYTQIPGLYGDRGLLPLYQKISFDTDNSLFQNLLEKPNILWIFKYIGLNEETSLDLMSLVAILISFLSLLFNPMRSKLTYIFLWACYYSICEVGQTFMWFQWDMLLLESGFLTILLAPVIPTSIGLKECKSKPGLSANVYNGSYSRGKRYDHTFSDADIDKSLEMKELEEDPDCAIGFWLIKWLCFRLMFASGLVKLTSECPSWWALDAMSWHYESQCIPTPLAWYAHQLPKWFQRFSVVATLVIESACPFLFFSPLRMHRLISGYAQVFLMVLILLTGNFNFFNIHIIILHICLADDEHFGFTKKIKRPWKEARSIFGLVVTFGKCILLLSPFVIAVPEIIDLFGLNLKLLQDSSSILNFEILSQIKFSKEQFFEWLAMVVPITIWIAISSLSLTILNSLRKCLKKRTNRIWALLKTFIFSNFAIYLFASSCVPYYHLDASNASNFVWPIAYKWYDGIRPYRIANSYGLFRSMTGVGGRPEIIIKGSNHLEKGWKEYNFGYKIGDVGSAPPFMVPHQPRLDWQMWFAALDSYQYNPWLAHLVYKILIGERDVLNLLQRSTPFGKPPKYVKIDLYIYHYTTFLQNSSKWWTREKVSEYFPPMTKDSPEFLTYLFKLGFKTSKIESPMSNRYLAFWVNRVRNIFVNQGFQPHQLIWGLSLAALLLCFKQLNPY